MFREESEFVYDDVKNSTGKEKKGYEKIRNCCEVASADGYIWVWVDTCCIDKSSSAELSEAINSMFRWYSDANVCYTHLSDVEVSRQDRLVSAQQLSSSRWPSRGWTLQELIAPNTVRFYDRHWVECGNRNNISLALSQITNIDQSILERNSGADEREWLYSLSISKRMSWAATRQTTRAEDRAYCLLGLFDVNMPMLYGEGGPKAFYRLQEEIMKHSVDHTILAWSPAESHWDGTTSVLADSPLAFRDGSRIEAIDEPETIEMTSRGLKIAPNMYDPADLHEQLEGFNKIGNVEGIKVLLINCFFTDDQRGQ